MPDTEEPSMRDALEAAYDEETKDEPSGEESEVAASPDPDAGGDGPTEGAGTEESVTATASGGAESVTKETEAALGSEETPAKFLPPEGAEQEGEPEATQDTVPETPQERAPVAWRGEAKEEWSNVPPAVRQEVLRREKEVNDVLRDTAGARQFEEDFSRTIAPFQQFIAAEGSDPLTATRNMMQTAASLRVGTPQQKAQLVAGIVRQFGVDISALDNALAGQPNGGGQPGNGGITPEAQEYIAQQMAPVQQFMSGLQNRVQQRNQLQEQEVAADIQAFQESPDHPYFEDVREDMSLLFQRADQQGQKLTMEDAYTQAVRMNPKLWDLTQKRQAAQEAQKENKSLEAKKRAAASLRGTSPPTSAPAVPTDMRGQLAAAWDKAAGE